MDPQSRHSWLPELPVLSLCLWKWRVVLIHARVHLDQSVQDSGFSSGPTGSSNEARPGDASCDPFMQNMFVLCHGKEVRIADVDGGVDVDGDGDGNANAGDRPWDPPLTAMGKLQARRVGRKIRLEGWNVTRVVVSPFLRCVQTAAEVIAGLRMLPSSGNGDHGSPDLISSLKVSIECGLAENLINKGVFSHLLGDEDTDGFQPWTLDLAELYSMLPTETRDPSFQPIEQKLPESRESSEDIRYRYTSTLNKIANICPQENILCITHGEAVRQSVSMMWPQTEVHGVAYCAYTHAQRPIFEGDDGSYILNADWELLTESGSCSGIFFIP